MRLDDVVKILGMNKASHVSDISKKNQKNADLLSLLILSFVNMSINSFFVSFSAKI